MPSRVARAPYGGRPHRGTLAGLVAQIHRRKAPQASSRDSRETRLRRPRHAPGAGRGSAEHVTHLVQDGASLDTSRDSHGTWLRGPGRSRVAYRHGMDVLVAFAAALLALRLAGDLAQRWRRTGRSELGWWAWS